MSTFKIASWNINSIRIRTQMLLDVIKNNKIDAILLQETKCQDENFPLQDLTSCGLNCIFTGQKSYNGVAIISKHPIDVELQSLPSYDIDNDDKEARYIEGS